MDAFLSVHRGRHTDEMCNFYLMYYTDVLPGQQLSLECTDNVDPGWFSELPPDNDVALPPNPLLEEMAEHPHLHHMAGEEEEGGNPNQNPIPPAVKKEAGKMPNSAFNGVDADGGRGSRGGGGIGSRYLLTNPSYGYDYSDDNHPYYSYSDWEWPSNLRSRYRYGTQRTSANSGGRRTGEPAHAFFGFSDDDDGSRSRGWQQGTPGLGSRPGGAAPQTQGRGRGGGDGREGGETPYNLQPQRAAGKPSQQQFLQRQRGGYRRPPPAPSSAQQQQRGPPRPKPQPLPNAAKPGAANKPRPQQKPGNTGPPRSKLSPESRFVCSTHSGNRDVVTIDS